VGWLADYGEGERQHSDDKQQWGEERGAATATIRHTPRQYPNHRPERLLAGWKLGITASQ